MTDGDSECSCVVDTDGLHGIATASGNIKAILLDRLQNGIVAVPICAWHEFAGLYEEEAAALEPYVAKRIASKKLYNVGAARIADQLNSGFPRGAYDENVELLTAAIATAHSYHILTSFQQVPVYGEMGCSASDLQSWIDGS